MVLEQLGFLLGKNVRYIWRSKCWTVFEVVLPLLITLPIAYEVSDLFSSTRYPASLFDGFNVTGDYRDILTKMVQLKSISEYYCERPMQFGISYGKSNRKKDVQEFVEEMQYRYRNEKEKSHFSITMHLFDDEAELVRHLKNDSFNSNVCRRKFIGGLHIEQYDLSSKVLRYKMLIESESYDSLLSPDPWFGNDPYSLKSISNPVTAGYTNLWSPGMLSLQFAIDDTFIQAANELENVSFYLELEKMPYPMYSDSSLTPFLGFITFFWQLIALINILHTVATIAGEKDNGMAAYLQVMGLSFTEFYLSHGIVAFVKLAVVLVPCTIFLLPGFVVVSSSLFLIAILIYAVGVVCFAMLLTSLFHKSGSATKGAIIIWIMSVILEVACKEKIPSTYVLRCVVAALNINFALAKATDAIRDSMNRDLFLGISNCFEGSYFFFTFGLGVVMMLFDIAWMVLLTAYLDNVYPSGDLPRKSPFYFLKFSCGKPEQSKSDIDMNFDETDSNENIQGEDKVRVADEADINVRGLTKIFDTVRAVDSLSFQACRGKVTVLLGHNGAGKSTTFAMLTGLASPSAGSIKICGIELSVGSMRRCQKNLGFCPQYNPIFDLLTVREHLVLCRKLKANPNDNVDDLLNDLQLKEKENELAKNLSGGMKRKLCIAMSLVGGSQVILLDEPTAGLDIGARRIVDDLLERYKIGRTILLTTHYMDEADRVGDRISIMVSGRLACSGSSEFLKAKFGTGYLLTIALKQRSNPSNLKEQIMKTIKYVIGNAILQSETSHQLTVLLPIEHKPKFSSLFAQLENCGPALGIDSFGVSLNSLEQVFLRVGELADNVDGTSDSVDLAKRQASRLCDSTQRVSHGFMLWMQQLKVLMRKQAICILRKWTRLISQFVVPLLMLILGCYMLRHEHSLPAKTPDNAISLDIGELSPAVILLQAIKSNISYMTDLRSIMKSIDGYEITELSSMENITQFMLERPKVLPPLGMGFISDANVFNSMTYVKALFNGNAKRGPMVALTSVSNARLGRRTDSIVLSLKFYDAADTADKESSRALSSAPAELGLLVPLIIIMFSFMVSGFIMQPVDERRTNFKHQQLLTGLSSLVYWLSIFIFNMFVYSFVCALVMLVLWISKFMLPASILLFLFLYFWASMPFMCCASFIFSSSVKAYCLMVLYTLVFPLFSLAIEKLLSWYHHPMWRRFIAMTFMVLEPNYSFSFAVSDLLLSKDASYSWQSFGEPALMLFFSGVFFTVLLIGFETKFITSFIVRINNARRIALVSSSEDTDAADEIRRMNSFSEDDYAISVCNLNKYYGSLHALKNLSFGVRADECFGLLGANGAGKTTTFDILTGVTLCDGGAAFINDQPVSKARALGFCPQFDALLEELTAREVLSLMTGLRGYVDTKERVESVLEAISLQMKADKQIHHYSGGQRRRLSVGLALISQAHVILLDEPTAGIDPKTRRQIWNLLSAMRDENCAMLLTSHSMDECEALCTRIGILLRGSLVATGAPQQIKSRFGEGCTMTFTLRNESAREQLIDAVTAKFPNAILKTLHPSVQLVWHLQRTPEVKWSKIFEDVHQFASSQFEVLDYTLAQTTLEEAFLRLSQMDDEEAVARAHRNLSIDMSSLV